MLRQLIPVHLLRKISSQFQVARAAYSVTASAPKGNVKLSESCIEQLKGICTEGTFLRITVEGGGCSGFKYKFDLDKVMNADDVEFGTEDARVVVDETSIGYCDGSTIDYQSELIRSGFRILKNPKAEQGCSCGSSFAIKID